MSRSRIAAILAALTVGIAALVGSAAPASADTNIQTTCWGWDTIASDTIKNDVTHVAGGGIEVEQRKCQYPDNPNNHFYQYRVKMLIYGEMRSNTRAVAKIFGSTNESCEVYPWQSDQFCASDPVSNAYQAWGIVQEKRDGEWFTYARGGVHL
ncbi:hypothetical protein [Stackebrandtia nassauensis]|uniref:Secreted protein n=1 Tax=Stackebrandtia nassauensis (strain DSM 44728 / CIP 108903 / NRRL B-16338 / NBRC 102104 / LLR-40K-21) TaxID=446470 RepID=D3PUP8_STANL|nr:hypothetical protein [Stackebrandtia nassauensis]ADD44922.1 hypothetical protein Snas_5288 [Stackebrandtia nassauensis DSM 44728]